MSGAAVRAAVLTLDTKRAPGFGRDGRGRELEVGSAVPNPNDGRGRLLGGCLEGRRQFVGPVEIVFVERNDLGQDSESSGRLPA